MIRPPSIALFVALVSSAPGWPQAAAPLHLDKTIPMPNVQGRIDHMSLDVKSRRLFVAALGNNTVEVIDVQSGKVLHSITGLNEPQGVLYLPATNRIYVANGKDGSVRIFDGSSYTLLKTVPYGDDADNLRFDAGQDVVYVGYGSGGLGAMDKDANKLPGIPLDSHPESFQLEKNGPRIFVNLPKSQKIAVVDRKTHSVVATWSTGGPRANYAMTLNEPDHRVFLVSRTPTRLIVLDTTTGQLVQSLPAVGDCDDVFFDTKRKRVYATGGEGAIGIYQQRDNRSYQEIGKISTVKGARTSYYSADLDQLYVAVRRQGSQPAEIRLYGARD